MTIWLITWFLGFTIVMLTPNIPGVEALDVEMLSALLVGAMRVDRSLIEEKIHGSIPQPFRLLSTRMDGHGF